MAHADMAFKDGRYRSMKPEDFGLKWGDPSAFAEQSESLITQFCRVLFGHYLNIEESRPILMEYSEDFWRHLRVGIEVAEKNPNGSVKERPRV